MPYWFYGPEEYQAWLAEAGLAARRVELQTKDMTYADRTGLEGWIRTTWHPYTHRVPPQRRDEFIAGTDPGDPASVLVAAASGYNFNEFLTHALPIVGVAGVVTLLMFREFFRKQHSKH